MTKFELLLELKSKKEHATDLLTQLHQVRDNIHMSEKDKLSAFQTIQKEITKVRQELDNLKKEINLLGGYRLN
jgi:septation ring formation regulator EzrA